LVQHLSQKHFVDLFSCFIECGLARVDLVIILDSSTSVGDDNYLKMKNFCKDFLKNADLDSGNVRRPHSIKQENKSTKCFRLKCWTNCYFREFLFDVVCLTMGAICGAGNAIPSGTPKFIPPVLSGVMLFCLSFFM
jgi:hypothetical protein